MQGEEGSVSGRYCFHRPIALLVLLHFAGNALPAGPRITSGFS